MTETNGPIKVIEGIPAEGNLELKKITSKKEVEKKVHKYGPWKTITLEPGDVLFTHPLSIHKSERTSAREEMDKRRLFINGFARVGANHKPYPGEGSGQQINFPFSKNTVISK